MAMFVSMVTLAVLSQTQAASRSNQSITTTQTLPIEITTTASIMPNVTIFGLTAKNSEENEESSVIISVVTVISLSAFLLFHSVGFNVIPFILMGELCPVKLKSLTSGIVMSFVSVLVFAKIKIFPVALEAIGGAGTYGFFASFCIGNTKS